MGASQDGSHEFISLLACIVQMAQTSLLLSYIKESHTTWLQDFNEGDEAYFASTANGWSCNELGLQWLQKVFHPHTKDKAGN